MNVFFDTSVLIPALVDQLQDHEASFQALVEYTQALSAADYLAAIAMVADRGPRSDTIVSTP